MRYWGLFIVVAFMLNMQVAYSQLPAKIFEIESILVDGCAGSDEGRNEMVILQLGANPVTVNSIRVDGAGSTGVIEIGKWPNTSNTFRGWAVPGTMAAEVASINATITGCGYLIEPLSGIIPAGKKCLMITSTEFSPAAHSFTSLADTLYVVFQNSGNTAGHFVNYGTTSTRTLVMTYTGAPAGADTVSYDRSFLINQSGTAGAQDGAGVRYSWAGVPDYFNDGCQAPYSPVSAAWTSPGTVCENDAPVNLQLLITGSTGGTWSGGGVSGSTFDPSGLSGNISVQYMVGSNPCADTIAHTIVVSEVANASISPAGPFCSADASVLLSAATAGGTWSGNGIINSSTGSFSPAAAGAGSHVITYAISGACGDTATTTILVNEVADATILTTGNICLTDGAVLLSASDTGGVWSGTGITDANAGVFDPSVSGTGTFWVSYEISGTCGDIDSVALTVINQIDATISSAGPFCLNDSSVILVAANAGGIWTGNGVTNASTGAFNPDVAGVGQHVVTYSIAGSCGNTDTQIIEVFGIPAITTGAQNESCQGNNDGQAWIQIAGGLFPFSVLWSNALTTDSIGNLPPGSYQVLVSDAHGCQNHASVTIAASDLPCFTPFVYVPNIFSPNDDGNNDVFMVHGVGIASLKMNIYDRWGEKVFESNDLQQSWDGKYQNVDVEQGVYVYFILVQYVTGANEELNGNITLVK